MNELFPSTRTLLSSRQQLVSELESFIGNECKSGTILIPTVDIEIGRNYFSQDSGKLKCVYNNPKRLGLDAIEFIRDDHEVYRYTDIDIIYLSEVVCHLISGNWVKHNVKGSLVETVNEIVESISDLPELSDYDSVADLYVIQHYLSAFINKYYKTDTAGSEKYILKCLKHFYASMTDLVDAMSAVSQETQDQYVEILKKFKNIIQGYEWYMKMFDMGMY